MLSCKARLFTTLPVLALLGVVAACSAYGEEVKADPSAEDGGPDKPADGDDDDIPDPDSSAPEDTDGGDAGTDSGPPMFSTACPACPGGATCIGGGCSGPDVTSNKCDAPVRVTANSTFVAFVCPEAETIPFPAVCGAAGDRHIAVLSLGPAGNGWTVAVSGADSFVVKGSSCETLVSGKCGSNGNDIEAAAEQVVMVGRYVNISGCVQLTVTATKI